MTKDEYEDFVMRYKGCGACFPMYHTLSRFEKMWFSSIQKDVAKLEEENAELKEANETLATMNNNMWVELEKKRAESQGITNKLHQLIEAKEIVENFLKEFERMDVLCNYQLRTQAEQFISEVEK